MHDLGPIGVGVILRLLLDLVDRLCELLVVLVNGFRGVAAKDGGVELDGLLYLVEGGEQAVHDGDADLGGLVAQGVFGVEDDLWLQSGELLEVEVGTGLPRGRGFGRLCVPCVPICTRVRINPDVYYTTACDQINK